MRKSERAIILPVTIGSMLEWYEFFLYIYWIPIIAKDLIDLSTPFMELITFLSVILVGFIARPLGGLIFGYIGDHWGRKTAFILSIILITIPSIFTAIMPTVSSWSLFAIIYIGIMKFLQGIPAGGELPGAICLLYEGAAPGRKKYLSSFTFIGPLIGQIISMGQCLLMIEFFSSEFLLKFGWRISFLIGGLIGIFGFFLRRKLHESPDFRHLKEKHEVLKNPIKHSFKMYKYKMFLGFMISIFEVMGFFLLTFFLVENAEKILNVNIKQELMMNIVILAITAILLPYIGKMGDKFKNKPLFITSAIGIIFFSMAFYFTASNSLTVLSFVFLGILMLFLCIQYALLPSLLAGLYPTSVRFTCIGLSFNICDSFIGGISTYLGFVFVRLSQNWASFILLLPVSAIIFLFTLSLIKIKKNKPVSA